MRDSSRIAASLLAASLVLPNAAAQEPQQQPFDVQRVVRESHGITAGDGQLLAIGGGIEASFETGRVVITPLLGSAAPRNMPMTLALDRILRGEETRVEIAGATRPIHRTSQVDYVHGHGIVERYVSRPDGVKQSVLIQQPIPGSGDLIVRMQVSTDLRCAVTERARQLVFDAGDLGGVHVGTVVGIDARGDRVEGYLRFDGEHLDLALPAAFVDRASYPIDVDPVLGARVGTGRSFSDNEIDIAFDVTNDVYGVVYQSEASATDRDIYLQFITGTAQRLGSAIRIVANSHRSELPKIASCNAADQFVVVWQDNGSGTFDIKCCTVDALTGLTSSIVDIAATGLQETNPDIGGDSTLGAPIPQCVCVWDEGTAILSCVVELNTNPPTINNVQTVVAGPPIDNPVISKDGGTARRYFVAYQDAANAVSVLPLDATAAVIGGPVVVAFSSTTVFDRPDIDGNGDHFTVVMEELEQGSTTDNDIRASHGVWSNGALQLVDSFAIEADQGFDESRPCVALMASKYVAAWIDVNASSTDIEATNLGLDTAARCGNEVVIPGSATRAMVNPAIVSRRSGGDGGSESGLLSNRELDLTNGNAVLGSRVYTTFGGGPVTVVAGTGGCSNGATAGIGSPAAIGNPDFSITLTGADPGAALAILLLDVNLLTPVAFCGAGCGGVILPQVTVQRPPVGGSTALRIPVPCLPTLAGASMYAQWLVLGGPLAGSCSLAPGLRPSDAIQITFGD
ncbi:MAG: hypothetical protein IPM29_23185 [Planctomycetes bacterium]|nr:hypothetical protein [Planctomycetota bacterium]